jgi:hypothetical protein
MSFSPAADPMVCVLGSSRDANPTFVPRGCLLLEVKRTSVSAYDPYAA